MTTEKRTEISAIGEFGLIDRITKDFQLKSDSSVYGIGDDAAVIQANGNFQLVTTDILVEGIHFDLAYSPLKHLGYKAVTTNLSDIYAMNAIPKQIVIALAISNRFSVEAIEELYAGVHLACERYKVDLIGGDTTASTKGLIISVTAIGEQQKDKIVYRNGAKEGDLLCVSGDLGAAYVGLQLLEREKLIHLENPKIEVNLDKQKYIVERQLKPEARKDIIDDLAKLNIIPNAMIDISDGLSSEIIHLCKQSNLGCQIEEGSLPIANETFNQINEFNLPPTTVALSGGEDYELLFAVDPKFEKQMEEHADITIIGVFQDAIRGVKLHTKGDNYHDMIAMGWNSLKE
jgi:thiamine-monophosphate kinase